MDTEWREGARRALADCRQVLDDPQTYGKHLGRLPGGAEEMKRLAGQLDVILAPNRSERARHRERGRERRRERGGDGISH